MVQRIDQKSDVFAHVAADVIFAGQKLRGLIYQVSSQYAIEQSFFVSLIEFFHTIGEQTKGGIQEDSFRMKGFQLSCYINHALTGGDHVINDQNIFSFYIAAQKLMGNDWIASIDYFRVITAFVEHTHVYTQHICQINCTAGTTLIRADDHQMLTVYLNVIYVGEQCLDKLVSRLYSLKTRQRDCILYTRVMRIKGDDIVHTHRYQLLQSQCAVQ